MRHGIQDNPLQTAVLNLFVSLKSRFPNLVVGQITRESVKKALVNGITADQVSAVLERLPLIVQPLMLFPPPRS
jgi:hypothetical protein